MRRFLAYVVMRLTVIGALIFNTQAVFSQDSSIRSDTGEFSPSTTLVYSLNNRVAEDYDLEKYPDRKNNGVKTLDEIDVEGEVRKRLDAAGVRNANVKIVHGDENGKGNQLRITISPLNTQELNNVKEIISVTGSFSVGTIADETVRYEANDEFFNTEKDLAAISYNGTTPYPTLHVKKADYDTLKTKAKEAYDNNNKTQDDSDNARKFYADGDSTTNDASSESETTVYLWSNKTKNDTYYKAFGKGTSDHVDEEVKAKIIATTSIDDAFVSAGLMQTGEWFLKDNVVETTIESAFQKSQLEAKSHEIAEYISNILGQKVSFSISLLQKAEQKLKKEIPEQVNIIAKTFKGTIVGGQ